VVAEVVQGEVVLPEEFVVEDRDAGDQRERPLGQRHGRRQHVRALEHRERDHHVRDRDAEDAAVLQLPEQGLQVSFQGEGVPRIGKAR
jgi:hypothetical protein